jgi:hypothetical protein
MRSSFEDGHDRSPHIDIRLSCHPNDARQEEDEEVTLFGRELNEFRRETPVRGIASYKLSVLGRWMIIVWVVCLLAMSATLLFRPTNPSNAYFVVLLSGVGVAWLATVVVLVVLLAYQLQARKERRSGYTWTAGFQNLNQIDPVSYVVIRVAGEPRLTDSERKDRVEQAHRWAADHPIAR